jgi:hypothetical protein
MNIRERKKAAKEGVGREKRRGARCKSARGFQVRFSAPFYAVCQGAKRARAVHECVYSCAVCVFITCNCNRTYICMFIQHTATHATEKYDSRETEEANATITKFVTSEKGPCVRVSRAHRKEKMLEA